MRLSTFRLLTAVSFVFALVLLRAETSPAPAGPALSLEGAVTLALEKNFDLRIQRTSNASAKEALEIEKGIFDPSLSVSASRQFDRTGTFNDALVSTQGLDTQVSVNQLINTGAVVTASGGVDRTRTNPTSSVFNPLFDSDVSLQVSQPLLKGAGSTVTRAGVNRAKLGVERAQAELTRSVLSVVRSVESAFFDLTFAREQKAVRVFSLEVAEKLLEEARVRRETGVATDIDVLQAEVGVANARRALIAAEQVVRNNEDALSALITPQDFGAVPAQLVLPALPTAEPSLDESTRLARLQSPDYASANLAVEQAKIDARVAERNRLPDLDLVAGLGYRAREGSVSDATSDVWGNDRHSWNVGATLTIPWGQRADKARFRAAKNSLEAADVRALQAEQDILVQVRAAVRAALTARETVKITALATELSGKQYELEKARYDAGVSTFRRVQESQEDYDTARINELQSQLDLRNAFAELARIEASSLASYRINLQ